MLLNSEICISNFSCGSLMITDVDIELYIMQVYRNLLPAPLVRLNDLPSGTTYRWWMWPIVLPADKRVQLHVKALENCSNIPSFLAGEHFVGQGHHKCILLDDGAEQSPFLAHNGLDGLHSALNCLVDCQIRLPLFNYCCFDSVTRSTNRCRPALPKLS
jgi:hypothetical protein